MFLLPLAMNDGGISFTEAITPFLPFLGVIAGAIIVGAFGVWNRRRGATETRAPDVNEAWTRADNLDTALDHERKLRRLLQDLLYEVLSAFHFYVARVKKGGSVELTESERKAHDTKVPNIGDKT